MEDFSVRIAVRNYELDTLGHVNAAVYHQYAEHARWEYLRAAGVLIDDLRAANVSPVLLVQKMRFRRELRAAEEVDVTCRITFPPDKPATFTATQRFVLVDGTLAAELENECGLVDLRTRRLVRRPMELLSSLSGRPEVIQAMAVAGSKRS